MNPPGGIADIIVTARRGEALLDPETELGEHDIADYGADTIAQLLSDIGPLIDGTGKAPVILVNGKRVGGAAGVTGFPPEALARLAILPPAAAARYGYAADRRVVNLVLKPKFASWDGSAGVTAATAGGRDSENGLVSRVVIDGSTYWNAQAQLSRDSMLLESARRLAVRPDPIDLQAHVTGIDGQEIDPALSQSIGRVVAIIDIPTAALSRVPALADFAEAAGHGVKYGDPGQADALLPASRSAAFNLGITHPLGAFSGSLNVNVATNSSVQRTGYPSLSLTLPAGSPWSPFGNDVALVPGTAGIAPLVSRQDTTILGISATASGPIAGWNANLVANYTRNWSNSAFDRAADLSDEQARIDAGDPGFNPYAALPRSALVATDRTRSRTSAFDARLIFDRALLTLPAGPVTVSLTAGFSRVLVTGSSTGQEGEIAFPDAGRTEFDWQAVANLPLTARGHGAGRFLGDMSASVTAGLSAIAGNAAQRQFDADLTWSPASALQLFASYDRADEVPDVAQLNGPRTETVIRLYDPIRQEIAEPVWITGGNPDLRRGMKSSLMLKGMWRPFHGRTVTLNLGYQRQAAKGGAAGFPQLTPAVEAAFPDRIVRDASGQLIEVDARPIAIDRDTRATLTTGVMLFWSPRAKPGSVRATADQWQLTLTVNHSWQLDSRFVIRPDLPALDRLGGDGGQPRHLVSWQLTAGRRGLGANVNGQWQSAASVRNADVAEGAGDYRYAALAQIDIGLFLEPGTLFDADRPHGWTSGMRMSLDVQNLFDSYQHVTLGDGRVPDGFDRYQLNPLGRTIALTLRKRF